MLLKIDLHVHTNHSDGASCVEEILEAAKGRGLDGIAITNHNTTAGAVEAFNSNTDLIVIPGVELKTPQGHVLALGVQGHLLNVNEKMSVFQTAEKIRELGGVIVISHPCTPFFSMKKEFVEVLKPHAVEVLNSLSPFFRHDRNQTIKLAERLRVAKVAGSDSHCNRTVGDAYTLIDSDSREIEDILEAIKKCRTQIYGAPSAWKYRIQLLFDLMFRSNASYKPPR